METRKVRPREAFNDRASIESAHTVYFKFVRDAIYLGLTLGLRGQGFDLAHM